MTQRWRRLAVPKAGNNNSTDISSLLLFSYDHHENYFKFRRMTFKSLQFLLYKWLFFREKEKKKKSSPQNITKFQRAAIRPILKWWNTKRARRLLACSRVRQTAQCRWLHFGVCCTADGPNTSAAIYDHNKRWDGATGRHLGSRGINKRCSRVNSEICLFRTSLSRRHHQEIKSPCTKQTV